MSLLVILSGLLAAITAAIHLRAGGREIARPLIVSELDEEIRLTMYACWHLVSVSLVLSALTLLISGFGFLRGAGEPIVLFISVMWLLFGGVFLFVTFRMAQPPGPFRYSQWTLLIPVGVLGIAGIL